jgi:hypothetical protein
LDASSSGASYVITNLELCFIDLVATGLLPAPAERAWWSAEEAIAYLVKGVPLPWKEWMGAGATASEIEQAGKELARMIGEDRATAWGRNSLQGPMEQLPSSDLRIQEEARRLVEHGIDAAAGAAQEQLQSCQSQRMSAAQREVRPALLEFLVGAAR